jgi:acyl-CoA synthetase (NDP forming)
MEGLKDGPRFLELAGRAHDLGKTIVVLKVGKSQRGAITTMAHTARMAGAGEVYEAAFRQYGIISTDTVETFLGAAQMAAHQAVPGGGRLLVMTSSGAGASLMADKASEYGIELADISDEAKRGIPQRRSAILTNPFDTAGASRSPGFLSSVCEAFAADTANDCLLMYLGPLAVRHEYARNFAAAAEKFRKTAAAIINLSEGDVRDLFQAHHIPVFDGATDACFRLLRAYIDYGRFLARRSIAVKGNGASGAARPAADVILHAHRDTLLLPQRATTELLALYGFDRAPCQTVYGTDEAEAAAHKLGYPVIMKAMLANIAHRSDAGLVSRKISDADELRHAFADLETKARGLGETKVSVSVESFVAHDFEMILGVKYDATFGPVILCGLGGVFTEVLKDYALRLAPLSAADVEDMLSSLKAFPVMQRAAKGSSYMHALAAALLRLSDLAVDLRGKISALDINPIAFASGSSRVTVLDAKIHVYEG